MRDALYAQVAAADGKASAMHMLHRPLTKRRPEHVLFFNLLLQMTHVAQILCMCPQVTLNAVAVSNDTGRFSLFSRFPVSNGASGLGALQQTSSEQPKSAGYELFGSTGASFTPVHPLLPVSLY